MTFKRRLVRDPPKTEKFHGGEQRLAGLHAMYHVCYGAEKMLERVLSGRADATIRFDGLRQLLENLGFEKRVRGSHHLFRKSGVDERINLQRAGAHAKPYQVKQVRAVILKVKLGSEQ